MIVFGPIPSRRLGRSLGIKNIPPKVCSYSCIYCQIGFTDSMSMNRKEFYSPDEIFKEVSVKVNQLQKDYEQIDYLTFIPNGEPTLDFNLGTTIDNLKSLGIKIAVVTNSSLIWDEEVKNDLMKADWISLKVDSAYQDIWEKINRPHGKIDFHKIIEGMIIFASIYKGTLVTETMLVRDINDSLKSLNKTALLIKQLRPHKSYILVPTRPPAEASVNAPIASVLSLAYYIFERMIGNTELIAYYEGTEFTYSCDAEKELLSILAVHPMRKDAVDKFLSKSNSTWDMIDNLINKNILRVVEYSNNTYFKKI